MEPKPKRRKIKKASGQEQGGVKKAGLKGGAKEEKHFKGGGKGKGKGKGFKRVSTGRTHLRQEKRRVEHLQIEELAKRVTDEAPRSGEVLGVGLSGAEPSNDGLALTSELFIDLPISQRTTAGLKAAGFVKMTEVQRGAIPHALAGRDILGEARTGSGKTLAFLVPLLELLYRNEWTEEDGLGALIVSPTRELAYQIFQVLLSMGTDHEVSAGCIVGGRKLEEEQKFVANMNVLVATPGRLLQHLDESPGFDPSNLLMLVLDEADRILDLGFQETMNNILGHLPNDRQTLLFSATLHTSVHRLGRAALRSPEIVSVHKNAESRTPDRLKQVYMVMGLDQKVDLLFSFLRSHSNQKVIVFVSACKQVRFLYEAFRVLKPGPAVMELHGRQSLPKRLLVFKEFTEKENAVALICTDVAARGVDFPEVDWVVQVDCPDCVDSYIHRVGRTARYESGGHSLLFLLPTEEPFVQKLKATRIAIKSISPKSTKLVTIKGKLSALLSMKGDIKHLAQKAYSSYMRSVQLLRDKELFDVEKLPREAFATSLGLADIPPMSRLDEPVDPENNPLRKLKNATPLQRLKEKIRAKKEAKKRAAAEGKVAEGAGADETDSEEREDRVPSKKLGRWERRQLRRTQAATKPIAIVQEAQEGEDEILKEIGVTEETKDKDTSASKTKTTGRQKLRANGKAAAASGKHTFFVGDSGTNATSELGVVANELGAEIPEESIPAPGTIQDRKAFLKQVAQELSQRDPEDIATHRARVQTMHREKRWQERLERQGRADGDEEPVVTLGAASGDESASNREASPEPQASPEPPKEAQRRPSPAAPKKVAAPPARAATVSPVDGLDELAALEREALSRLGGGGLFA